MGGPRPPRAKLPAAILALGVLSAGCNFVLLPITAPLDAAQLIAAPLAPDPGVPSPIQSTRSDRRVREGLPGHLRWDYPRFSNLALLPVNLVSAATGGTTPLVARLEHGHSARGEARGLWHVQALRLCHIHGCGVAWHDDWGWWIDPDHPTLEMIVEALSSDDGSIVGWGRGAARRLPPSDEPALVRTLGDHASPHRIGAAAALAIVGPSAGRGVPALVAASEGADAGLVSVAVEALGSASGPGRDEAQQRLAELLRGGTVEVKVAAVRALGDLGPDAGLSVPRTILPGLLDPSAPVREATVVSLRRCGLAGVAVLEEATRSEDPGLRIIALETVPELGEWAPFARAAVQERLDDEDLGVREVAERVLRRLSASGRPLPTWAR